MIKYFEDEVDCINFLMNNVETLKTWKSNFPLKLERYRAMKPKKVEGKNKDKQKKFLSLKKNF